MKALCFYFLLITSVISENSFCPDECECDMVNGLRSARCSGQRLTTVEVNIPPEVQYIDYSDNYISELSDHIFKEINLQNLIVLNMSSNMLSVISLRAFVDLKFIQIIDLSNNPLHTLIPTIFEKNLHLKKLFLNGNKFGHLDDAPFLESNSLEILDLSRCLIPHIHPEFFSKLPSLTTIDISQNFLIQLDVNIFNHLAKLKQLNFHDNKINCNDKTKELITYLQMNQIQFENICAEKVEKSQKMIIMPPDEENNLEKDHLLNWSFDMCDIETNNDLTKTNETKCEIIYDNKMMSIFLFAIVFCCGTIFGIFSSCLYMSCIYIMKKRKTRNVVNNSYSNRRNRARSRIVRCNSLTRPRALQRRDDFLLAENSFDIGLSTPVLARSNRHSTSLR